MSLSYRDRAFCPKSDRNNPKCVQCDRFFDREAYDKTCEKSGFEIPVAWFLEPPCRNNDATNLKEGEKK